MGKHRTHVKAAHKGDLSVNEAQFLVVGPEQDHVVAGTVERLEGVLGDLGEVESPQR